MDWLGQYDLILNEALGHPATLELKMALLCSVILAAASVLKVMASLCSMPKDGFLHGLFVILISLAGSFLVLTAFKLYVFDALGRTFWSDHLTITLVTVTLISFVISVRVFMKGSIIGAGLTYLLIVATVCLTYSLVRVGYEAMTEGGKDKSSIERRSQDIHDLLNN